MAALLEQRAKRMDGQLSVSLVVVPPDRRRRDIDNMLKAPLDAMCHAGLYQDDSQIVSLSITTAAPGERSVMLVEIADGAKKAGE